MDGFNFKIGDSVTFDGAVKECARINATDTRKAVPQRLMVVNRLSDECPAGTQYHYQLRGVLASESYLERVVGVSVIADPIGCVRANQCELVAYPEPV